MFNNSNIRTTILAVIIVGLGLTGVQAASADQDESKPSLLQPDDRNMTPRIAPVSPETNLEKVGTETNQPIPSIAPKPVAPIAAASVIDVLSWVCKTTLTLVGIGAWVTNVYVSGGILFTVSTWVVRYVTIPSLLCSWL